jgi:hypothetical protein
MKRGQNNLSDPVIARELGQQFKTLGSNALTIGRTGHAISRFGLPPVGKKSASGRGIFTVSTREPLHIVQLS